MTLPVESDLLAVELAAKVSFSIQLPWSVSVVLPEVDAE